MYGLATATTDPSIPTMITPRVTLSRVSHGLSLSLVPVALRIGGRVPVPSVTWTAMVADHANTAQFW